MKKPSRRVKNYHTKDCRCDHCLVEAYGYDWRRLVPGTGWLRDYMNWALEVTDAPPIYHIASGLACLSTVVGANTIFQPTPGDKPVNLNMWILTAGSSAKQRKSTAVNLVRQVLSENFSYFLVPWSGSPEAIYSKLVQQPQCVMVIPEFPSFLAQMNQKYAQSMKTQLMDLFDGEENEGRVTREKGDERIESPRINMIGGAALDLLDKHLKDLDFRSGFLSRMFFVAGDRKKWMRRPRSFPDDLKHLQHGLLQVAKWAAQIRVVKASKEADDGLADLSRWIEKRTDEVDPSYSSLIFRNDAHAHKIAALYAASMQHKTVYSSLVTQRVTPMIQHCIDVIETYLINMMSDSDFVRAAQRIKAWLKESKYKPGDMVPFKELVNRSVDVRHAHAAVEQLEGEEILSKVQGNKGRDEERATNKVQFLRDDF